MEYSENYNVIFRINNFSNKDLKLKKYNNTEEKILKIYSDKNSGEFQFNYDWLFENKNNQDIFDNNKLQRLFEKSIVDGLDLALISYGSEKTGKTYTMKNLFYNWMNKLNQNKINAKISKINLDKYNENHWFINNGEKVDNKYYIDYDENFNYFKDEKSIQIITILFKNSNKENGQNSTKITFIDFSISSSYNKSISMGNEILETTEKNNELYNFNKFISMWSSKDKKDVSISFNNCNITKVLKEYLTQNYLVNFILHFIDNKKNLDVVLNTLAFSKKLKKIPQNYNLNLKKRSIWNRTGLSSIIDQESEIKVIDLSKNTKNKFKKKNKKTNNSIELLDNFIKNIDFNEEIKKLETENILLKKENYNLKKCSCSKHIGIFENIFKKHEEMLIAYQNKFDIKIQKIEKLQKNLNNLLNKSDNIKNNKLKLNNENLSNNILNFKSKTINSLYNIKNELKIIKLKTNKFNFDKILKDINYKDYIKPNNDSILSNKTKEELINIKSFIWKLNQLYYKKKNSILTIKNKKLNYKDYIKYNFSQKDTFDLFKNKFELILSNLFSKNLFNNKDKYNIVLLNIIRELMHSIIENNRKIQKIDKYRHLLRNNIYKYSNFDKTKVIEFMSFKNSVKIIEKNYIKYKNKKNPIQLKFYKVVKGKFLLKNLMSKLSDSISNIGELLIK